MTFKGRVASEEELIYTVQKSLPHDHKTIESFRIDKKTVEFWCTTCNKQIATSTIENYE